MMKGQLAGLMRQAQQMQENMKKAQDALAEILVEGASGGGLVKVTMTCRHDVKRVVIDPSLLGDDKDMIEEQTIMDAMMQAEVINQLMEAINQLPQGCRQVLQLAIFEKLSNDEIATNLTISINTVKSQKKRALQLLRTRLDARMLTLLLFLLPE